LPKECPTGLVKDGRFCVGTPGLQVHYEFNGIEPENIDLISGFIGWNGIDDKDYLPSPTPTLDRGYLFNGGIFIFPTGEDLFSAPSFTISTWIKLTAEGVICGKYD
jgi:hypothetical protein